MHIAVCAMAFCFQICNATCLGAWLAAYGPTTQEEWAQVSPLPQFVTGLAVWYIGLSSNFFHDEELREIRRKEMRRQDEIRKKAGGGKKVAIEKHYQIPQAGLFKYMLYPHYFCEWVEWTGFWLAAGWGCAPARAFLVNELFTMLPRAINGRKWYIDTFGEEKIKKKWTVIPGVW